MSSTAFTHVATSIPSSLADAQDFFRLGMMYSTGAAVSADHGVRSQVVQHCGYARQRRGCAAAPGNR